MSYAQLSKFNVDLLLSEQHTGLREQLITANEAKQRVVLHLKQSNEQMFQEFRRFTSEVQSVVEDALMFWNGNAVTESILANEEFFEADITLLKNNRTSKVFTSIHTTNNIAQRAFDDLESAFTFMDVNQEENALWSKIQECIGNWNSMCTNMVSMKQSEANRFLSRYNQMDLTLSQLNNTVLNMFKDIFADSLIQYEQKLQVQECYSSVNDFSTSVLPLLPIIVERMQYIKDWTSSGNYTLLGEIIWDLHTTLNSTSRTNALGNNILSSCWYQLSAKYYEHDIINEQTASRALEKLQADVPNRVSEQLSPLISFLQGCNSSLHRTLVATEKIQQYRDGQLSMLEFGKWINDHNVEASINYLVQTGVGMATISELLSNVITTASGDIIDQYQLYIELEVPAIDAKSVQVSW